MDIFNQDAVNYINNSLLTRKIGSIAWTKDHNLELNIFLAGTTKKIKKQEVAKTIEEIISLNCFASLELELQKEPTNPFDVFACLVAIKPEEGYLTRYLGYIPHKISQIVSNNINKISKLELCLNTDSTPSQRRQWELVFLKILFQDKEEKEENINKSNLEKLNSLYEINIASRVSRMLIK